MRSNTDEDAPDQVVCFGCGRPIEESAYREAGEWFHGECAASRQRRGL